MKKSTIVLLMITVMVGSQVIAQKKKTTSVKYEFPKAMAAPIRAEFMKQCEKGRVLYEINCSGCHNKIVKGKEIIPDFSPEQLIGYELRVKNAQHESNLPDENVTAEELGLIMTFLTYKQKNKL